MSEREEFENALFGEKGELDAWLEVNKEAEVRRAITLSLQYCAERKQREIDELAAQVEVMREYAIKQRDFDYTLMEDITSAMRCELDVLQERALSITGPEALAEVKARTLEEAARKFAAKDWHTTQFELEDMAASIRKGE